MYPEAKKLHLIEEILKIENDEVLAAVESVIVKNMKHAVTRRSFKDCAGMMSEEEINKLEKTIEEGCETINTDDWK
jgi:hypothetical protein